MTTFMPAMCLACQRLVFKDGESTCAAFPKGIPSAILLFGADHRVAFEGDGGIRFLQKQGPEALQAFEDWRSTFAVKQ
jgi:hypothetical protein